MQAPNPIGNKKRLNKTLQTKSIQPTFNSTVSSKRRSLLALFVPDIYSSFITLHRPNKEQNRLTLAQDVKHISTVVRYNKKQ